VKKQDKACVDPTQGSVEQNPNASTRVMYRYRISGLTVAAEMSLPGAIEISTCAADVDIRFAEVPPHLANPTRSGPNWELDRSHFLLRLPGIGRLLATDGIRLDLWPEAGVDPGELPIFAIGSGMGALLYQRGETILHASAVVRGDAAHLFCGPSGSGKSTLAAALCKRGYAFASDDVSVIRLTGDGVPRLWPDGRQLKLLDSSITAVAVADTRRDTVRTGFAKYFVDPPSRAVTEATPVGAIFILTEDRRLEEPRIEALKGAAAAAALHRNGYRPRLAQEMMRTGDPLRVPTAILRHVPVYRLSRPFGLHKLPQLVSLLEEHWADHGAGVDHAASA
jgi:hypothetical protein